MSNRLCTFMNIFNSDIELDGYENKFVTPKKIIIPIIQRDYAQGRNNSSVNRVRKNFLDALYKAVTEKPITLDFVYGDIDDNGILTPLDGQQRLTTLFLLHWYAAKKENISADKIKFLENFSYATRPDSREFCIRLIKFNPTFCEKNLSAEIENQEWFPLGWKKDSTVSSMLNMLDAINEKFFGVKNLWSQLEGNAISFYFLPIKKMGLTDEIYITMNSRGKPLTNFEHFKAEFKNRLDLIDPNYSAEIIRNFDTTWTDLLWKYRDKNNLVDNGFLNYFRFLCDVLLYQNGGTTQGKDRQDVFLLLDEFFGDENKIISNVQFMEKSFNCWLKIDDIDEFFSDRISCGSRRDKNINQHVAGKIIVYYSEKNLFKNCLDSYDKNFSLGRTVLLYAFLEYLLNYEDIYDEDFRRRIRIVNNLVINSEYSELSDSETRQGGNRMPAILEQVKNIVTQEKFLRTIGPNFNDYQLKEEMEKLSWTKKHPDDAELLFELEDHCLLYGQIGIVGLDYPEYFAKFISLFKCDYEKINCALLSKGDYLQVEHGWRYQLGSQNIESWQNLFHKSLFAKRYGYTQATLSTIFSEKKTFSEKVLDGIIEEYISDCEKNFEFDWIYYYLQYEVFRPKKFGKYFWHDFEHKPYEMVAMLTNSRISTNAYQPFLKAAVSKKIFDAHYNEDWKNPALIFGEKSIECLNDSYVVKNLNTGLTEMKLKITQSGGIDRENRIETFKKWAEEKNLFK